jgi:hypothetical protein
MTGSFPAWMTFRLVVSYLSFLLCATSVFSVPLWWFSRQSEPQRHREHRGYTEKSQTKTLPFACFRS